jgi:glycosyltransferase involved in cell wall biosynthesis
MKIPSDIALIITTFNSEEFVSAAIDSVKSQTVAPTELIIIDNGSVDSTQSIASKYGIPFIVQTDGLVGASRNLGIRSTHSPLIKFLDGDDILINNALEDLYTGYSNSNAELIYGKNINFINQSDTDPDNKLFAHLDNPIHSAVVSNSLIQRSSFLKYGFPDQDNHSWNRWLVNSKRLGLTMHKIDNVVSRRRIHDSNVSHDELAKKELFNLIASNLKNKNAENA